MKRPAAKSPPGPWNGLVTRAQQSGEGVVVQGVYRVWQGGRELLESFVAARGPMGWRYFGRVHPPDSEEELFTVDYVVDAKWGLLRYRLLDQSGTRIVATPATGGIEVVAGRPGDERTETVAGASAVWSSSPCSLLVVDWLLSTSGRSDVAAVRIGAALEPEVITVRLERRGSRQVVTPTGNSEAELVGVMLDAERFEALIRSDLPLLARGWFDLVA
ncbi:MAG TPA: hypothetical protein VF972_01645 [Actinomycetota bacterium]